MYPSHYICRGYLWQFTPEKVDWFSVGADVLGIGGDVLLVIAPGPGSVVFFVSQLVEVVDTVRIFDHLESGEPIDLNDWASLFTGFGIERAIETGRLAPGYGSIFSIASLAIDIAPIMTLELVD